MNRIPYYKPILADDGNIYSVDMVRISFDIGSRGQNLCNMLSDVGVDDALKDARIKLDYFHSFREFQYEHLWTISDEQAETKATLSVGLHLRGSGSNDGKSLGFLEFNPNKVISSEILRNIIGWIQVNSVGLELKRYDMAIDIPCRRQLCKLDRIGKKMYQLVIKDDGVTEYLGRRNTAGFTKLYDKTLESGLSEDVTRLEITLEPSTDVFKTWPRVYMNDEQYSLEICYDLNDTERAIVSMLRDIPDATLYTRQLGRKVRKRIEPYLGDRVLELNKHAISACRELALSFVR